MIVTLDFETYYDRSYSLTKLSEIDYILSPLFQTIMCAVKINDGPSEVFIGEHAVVQRLSAIDWANAAMLAHNTRFDGAILAWRYGIKPKMYLDTLSMARALTHAHCGGSSLAKVSEYLGLPPKGKEVVEALGKRLEDFTTGDLHAYIAYCKRDNDNCKEIFDKFIEVFPRSELALIDIILRMFIEPQVRLDPHELAAHLGEVRAQQAEIFHRVAMIDKSVFSSAVQFAALLEQYGVDVPQKPSPADPTKMIPALAKNDRAFKELCQDEGQSLEVQALLAARLSSKSTGEETRTKRLLELSLREWPDGTKGRAPVPLKYYGAHTGRLSGDGGFNWQNFKRGSRIRQAIMAEPGHRILHRDASQIEARMNAYLSGCYKLVQAFGAGRDIYSEFATEFYRQKVTKADKLQRFVGKTCLAAGTRVLTGRGWIGVETVTASDVLWDGVEWVMHDGLMAQGQRETLTLSGVCLTPDHRVWCGTEWKEAQYLALDGSGRYLKSALAAASYPSWDTSPADAVASNHSPCDATAADPSIQSIAATSKPSAALAAMIVLRKQLWRKGTGPTLRRCLTTAIAAGCSTGWQSTTLRPVYDIANAGPRHRFTVLSDDGPLIVSNCILGLGYGMGAERLRHTLFIGNGGPSVNLAIEEAESLVNFYRTAYREIRQLWYAGEASMGRMMAMSGQYINAKRPGLDLSDIPSLTDKFPCVELDADAVWLPNGMAVAYPDLRFDQGVGIHYSGPYGQRKRMFGGKFVENMCQALCRIIVTDIAVRVYYATGRLPFLTTHDSLDYHIPERDVAAFDTLLAAEFAKRPSWAPGLPLASEGGWGRTLAIAENENHPEHNH